MLTSRALALLLSLMLACGAAARAADGDKDMRRVLARPQRLLLNEELRGNCAGLSVTTRVHIDRLRELEKRAKVEREASLPPTLVGEWPAAAAVAQERNRVEALNVVLDAKGCEPINVEEELKKSPPPSASPKDGPRTGAKIR